MSECEGKPYWLVGSDGGVFAFGDAPFLGSLPSLGLSPDPGEEVVGLARSPGGYWLVPSLGPVARFGDVPDFGYYQPPPWQRDHIVDVENTDAGGYTTGTSLRALVGWGSQP